MEVQELKYEVNDLDKRYTGKVRYSKLPENMIMMNDKTPPN